MQETFRALASGGNEQCERMNHHDTELRKQLNAAIDRKGLSPDSDRVARALVPLLVEIVEAEVKKALKAGKA